MEQSLNVMQQRKKVQTTTTRWHSLSRAPPRGSTPWKSLHYTNMNWWWPNKNLFILYPNRFSSLTITLSQRKPNLHRSDWAAAQTTSNKLDSPLGELTMGHITGHVSKTLKPIRQKLLSSHEWKPTGAARGGEEEQRLSQRRKSHKYVTCGSDIVQINVT